MLSEPSSKCCTEERASFSPFLPPDCECQTPAALQPLKVQNTPRPRPGLRLSLSLLSASRNRKWTIWSRVELRHVIGRRGTLLTKPTQTKTAFNGANSVQFPTLFPPEFYSFYAFPPKFDALSRTDFFLWARLFQKVRRERYRFGDDGEGEGESEREREGGMDGDILSD